MVLTSLSSAAVMLSGGRMVKRFRTSSIRSVILYCNNCCQYTLEYGVHFWSELMTVVVNEKVCQFPQAVLLIFRLVAMSGNYVLCLGDLAVFELFRVLDTNNNVFRGMKPCSLVKLQGITSWKIIIFILSLYCIVNFGRV